MVLEVGKQTMVIKKAARNKMAVRNKNGRKRAEKIFALYAPFPYYWHIGIASRPRRSASGKKSKAIRY